MAVGAVHGGERSGSGWEGGGGGSCKNQERGQRERDGRRWSWVVYM
jgi:hypothetical protein